ncbi:hypothetical protein C5748_22900 [Phyllobacterium phragmitis]|uniref:Uncharacterized protein n=1 Tax=Phyllobacterium phragmitis TaxID=2670329 RepID=A0A2S9IL25_9HYPH|nr:hypothetical protein [Phyllobacterium phragmitis]PRD41208.1 hypothetical protein C5748_22900 [Phyllobacterium phragmitis]
MTSLLPPLYEGHAPIYLHNAFQDAVDAYEDWIAGTDEPAVNINGKNTRISVVFRRLWRCTDTVPMRTLDALRDLVPEAWLTSDKTHGTTYAQAARAMRSLCEERRKRRLPVVLP